MGEQSFAELMREIDGVEVFAWRPVRMFSSAGFWREGYAWLRPVLRRRRIGFPSYFHTEIQPPTKASQPEAREHE